MGLYFNFSIVLLYIPITVIYLIYKTCTKGQNSKFKLISFRRYSRYLKLIFNSKVIFFFIIISIISNTIVLYQNKKYDNLYQEGELTKVAIVVSNKVEKEYQNQYKIKIIENNKYKNTYLYLRTEKNQELEYGDKIEFLGQFDLPSEARNYGGFSYKEYLKTLKIYGSVDSNSVKVIEKNKMNVFFTCANKAYLKIQEQISSIFPKQQAELLKGILLGDTANVEEQIQENFRITNISHVLAVSRFACFIYCNGNKLIV